MSTPIEPGGNADQVPGLELRNFTVQVAGRTLIEPTSLRLPGGGLSVLVGGSGAGKSVLLRILAGLLPRDGDTIQWQGDILRADGEALGRVGILFQQFALFDELGPVGNVEFASDHRRDPSRAPKRTPPGWLDELRVPRGVHVANLSGGQRQRLALARTLAADPEVILYDEPTSGLDAASARQVAELIQQTQRAERRTSLVVTHDYPNLLPVAEHVVILDAATRELRVVPPDEWHRVPELMEPVATKGSVQGKRPGGSDEEASARPGPLARIGAAGSDLLAATGGTVVAGLQLPMQLIPRWPRVRWGLRFFGHYLRLVAGPSAFFYLLLAGMIAGFTTTYFTFRFLPQELYTKPLLLEDLLSSIGFALYRVLTPVLAAILIAARCGAAVAADVGVKRYGAQVDALATLGVRPAAYLYTPILLAFLVGVPALEWVSYQAARYTSLAVFAATHPEQGPHFWHVHFTRQLYEAGSSFHGGTGWLLLKLVAGALGVGAIAYHQGIARKESASDVSHAITRTVLAATLWVLVVQFVVALFEF